MLNNDEKSFSPEYLELAEAIKDGDQAKIREIVKSNPGILNEYEGHFSPLSLAIDSFSHQTIDLLISLGAKLDIWSASSVGKNDDLRKFIEEDPDLVNEFMKDEGWAPIHCAIYFNNDVALRTLIDNGADVDLISNNDYSVSPLVLAIVSGKFECARTLIDNGADPYLQPITAYAGANALHSAAYHGSEDIIELLLDRGIIDPNLKDGNGKTAADYAHDQGFESCARIIEHAIKKWNKDE